MKGDMGGEWNYGSELLSDLVLGKMSLLDVKLQRNFLDWAMTDTLNVFRNREDGTIVMAQSAKRGNRAYAQKNSQKLDTLLGQFDELVFDKPVPGFRDNYRYTRVLFFTLTYSNVRYTSDEAWASLRSSLPDDVNFECAYLNNFGANISSIFGTNGKLTCKESNGSGYPAPHVLVILDRFVLVKRHIGKDGSVTWRIADDYLLRRVGKDRDSRRLSMYDVESAVQRNPIWTHGEMDIQGVVKGSKFGLFSNVITYIWKYMIKSADLSKYPEINDLNSISECKDESLRTMLYTHYNCKLYNLRTIVVGKAFKTRLNALPTEQPKEDSKWERIVSIPQWYGEIIQPAVDRYNDKILQVS